MHVWAAAPEDCNRSLQFAQHPCLLPYIQITPEFPSRESTASFSSFMSLLCSRVLFLPQMIKHTKSRSPFESRVMTPALSPIFCLCFRPSPDPSWLGSHERFCLQVPSGLRGQAHLKVWGNRHLTEGGYIFHNFTTVTVESKGTAVFIQTDKPIYKPKHKGAGSQLVKKINRAETLQ